MKLKNSSNKPSKIREMRNENEDLLFLEPARLFDDAIIGLSEPRGNQVPLVVYDGQRIVELLQERENMDQTEAQEYYEYHISGVWMGAQTPLFVERV